MNTNGKLDCFNFLRLVAAYLVVCGHMHLVAGHAEPAFGTFTLSGTGIAIFLSLSGYLVTQSWHYDPHFGRFALRRALRLFPALIVCVAFCALALGPFMSTLPQPRYFDSPQTWAYLRNIILDTDYALPGLFETVPLRGMVNISLATLPIGALLWLTLAVINYLTTNRPPWVLLIFVAALCTGSASYGHYYTDPAHLGTMEVHQVLTLAPYFWVGSLGYVFRRHIEFTIPRTLALYSISALIAGTSIFTFWSWIAIPYVALSFATQTDKLFRVPWRIGDLSYGIYLYSFPVQQALWQYYHTRLPFMQILALSIVIATLFGLISWALIEYPALRLKRRIRPKIFKADPRYDFKTGSQL